MLLETTYTGIMSLLQLEMKFGDLAGKIDKLIGEVKQCKEGMNFMNINFEDMKKEWKEIRAVQNKIEDENKELKREITDIKKQLNMMKVSIETEEKTKTAMGIELSLIPEVKDERLIDIILKLGKVVDINIKKENIKSVFRKKISGKICDIVLHLDSVENRDTFLKAIKKKNPTIRNLGFTEGNNPIYCKELLTKFGKDLYFSALKFKKEKNWKFLWINEGRVLLREKEGGRYYVIRSFQDIENLRK